VLWNGVITQNIQDAKPVIERTLSQGFSFLPNENQSLWSRWLSGTVRVKDSESVSSIRLANLEWNKKIGFSASPESMNYQLQLAEIPRPKPFFGEKVAVTYSNLLIFGRTFFQVFAFFGLFLFFAKIFIGHKWLRAGQVPLRHSQSLDLLTIGLAALFIGFIARTSGTLGSTYNPERTGLQVAIVVLIPTAMAIEYVLFRKKIVQIFLAVPVLFFLIVLMFQATSLSGYITSSDVSRISNLQRDYSSFIISESERNASRWLSRNIPTDAYLQTDGRGYLALFQNRRRTDFISLDPVNLLKGSYIYTSNSNVSGQVASAQASIVFPEDYIDRYYQIIYSSNRARIYH
jgi:hypothetical protein